MKAPTSVSAVVSTVAQSTSKQVDGANGLTAKTLTAERTYLTGTSGASFAITLPAASAAVDGQIYLVMSVNARSSVTWTSSGATFVGVPSSLTANVPVSVQYDHATLKWYLTQ